MATNFSYLPEEVESKFLEIATPANPFRLRNGQELQQVTLAYETYGQLNPSKDNAILLFHALTGSQHAAGYNSSVPGAEEFWQEECHLGWWDEFVGPGKAVNTNRFFVICANYLGGCYGSTGPGSINPQTRQPFGSNFPRISIGDIVESQVRLLDHLGIKTLHAAVGGSLGGMMSLLLAMRYPERVRIVVPIATGMYVTSLQRIQNFEQICAIEQDPFFARGDYYGKTLPHGGLAMARMIGHKTFVSLRTIEQRARAQLLENNKDAWYQLQHPVESYMRYQGQKFVERFDANTYLRIIDAWQGFNLLAETHVHNFTEAFLRCRHQHYMVFSIDSDVCYYPEEQEEIVTELKKAKVPHHYITVHSDKGHDSFLVEPDLFRPHLAYSLENGW